MTRLRMFCFALLCFTTSSVLAALPDLAHRSQPSFVASRAYFIANDQYLVATKPDGEDEVRICPGRYVERASGPVCRVLDPDGLNHFLGGKVTGETFTLDETCSVFLGQWEPQGNDSLAEGQPELPLIRHLSVYSRSAYAELAGGHRGSGAYGS